ncbi:MAG: hypothetical protein RR182_07120, partial [Alistipes sp.]
LAKIGFTEQKQEQKYLSNNFGNKFKQLLIPFKTRLTEGSAESKKNIAQRAELREYKGVCDSISPAQCY